MTPARDQNHKLDCVPIIQQVTALLSFGKIITEALHWHWLFKSFDKYGMLLSWYLLVRHLNSFTSCGDLLV